MDIKYAVWSNFVFLLCVFMNFPFHVSEPLWFINIFAKRLTLTLINA